MGITTVANTVANVSMNFNKFTKTDVDKTLRHSNMCIVPVIKFQLTNDLVSTN